MQDSHWAHQRLLIQVRAGSKAHGLDTAESDEDSRGVCIPPTRYLFGLSEFEQWQSEGGDHVIFGLQKFVRLALEGNPNIIETLYTREQDILYSHDLAQELLQYRDRFLSKKLGVKFGRYAIHQLQKIERHHRWLTQPAPIQPDPLAFGATHSSQSLKFPDTSAERAYRGAVKHHRSYQEWRKNRNPKRAILEEKYGYDTKHAMHLCRLLNMGCEILETGVVQVYRTDRDWLLGIREGQLAYHELLDWVRQAEARLAKAEKQTDLPETPDFDDAELLVIRLTQNFLAQSPTDA